MRRRLRFWFTFEDPVSRRDYLVHGAGLAAVKYGVDAALIALASGTLWTPVDYLASVPFLLSTRLEGAAPYLAPVLVAWTLPFMWIGITMTVRRLLDTDRSAWWSLFFFVPYVSYVLLAFLAMVPGSGGGGYGSPAPPPRGARLPSALLSIGVGLALGLAMLLLGVLALESYGLALFFGMPFVAGLVTAYVLCLRYPASNRETLEVVGLTMGLIGGVAFAIGIEGVVCLLMAAPLSIGLALMGALMGRYMARIGERPVGGAALIALLYPGAAALETGPNPASLREVASAVVIEAGVEEVWAHVVEFSPIPEPRSPLFRMGIAYPTHAEIDGQGVGAVRYCVFSTGAFVEPITVWEPGKRLAFDVIESPPPLRELSFAGVSPPHLEGYLEPRAGEFRLVSLGPGRTRLEGSTWYEQRLRPEGYWVLFSDYIIGRIHRRVLRHIRAEAESGPAVARGGVGTRHRAPSGGPMRGAPQ